MDVLEHLKALRTAAGLSQAALADRAGTSQPQIRRLENGDRELTREWAIRLAPHLNTKPVRILFPDATDDRMVLPIVGKVGASTNGEVLQETDHGPFGEIFAPVGAQGTEVAVDVEGHSMGLYAPDGSLILYSDRKDPPQEYMLGHPCIVGLDDGRVLVKRLLRGSKRGLFDLESMIGDTMKDQRVKWAALVDVVIHPHRAKNLRIA